MNSDDRACAAPEPQAYAWMETLLRLYFARVEKAEGLRLLGDHEGRLTLVGRWQRELSEAGMPSGMLDSDEGRNLTVAVLALRLRFEQPDAIERVRKNIAMRNEGNASRG